MTDEELKKSIEEIKTEIKNNNDENIINDERMRMSMVNNPEYQATITAFFSIFAYIIIFFVLGVTHYTPASMIVPLIYGGSIAAGITGNYLLNKLFSIKERLKNFTNAKKQSELLEQEIEYTIKFEKNKSRNQALQEIIDTLIANQKLLSSLSSKYTINDKNAPLNKEEANKRIQELKKLLQEHEEELDDIATKRVLHDRTRLVRERIFNFLTPLLFSLLGGVGLMMITTMPFILVKDIISIGLPTIITTLLVGITGTGAYLIKKTNDILKVFHKFNDELGENKLPATVKDSYEELQELNGLFQDKIKDITSVGVELEEQKRMLEAFSGGTSLDHSEEDKKEYALEQEEALPTPAVQNQPKKLTLMNKSFPSN